MVTQTALKAIPDPLDLARQVIATEIDGLEALRAALDGSFSAVADLLLSLAGRVVVTGMGKSGHVARKVAATFASTGTPAQFVHPGEASHGDLGMITQNDAVMALSNFGETAEMADLIAYTRRFGIKLIAVTAFPDSTLARAADLVLLLPRADEACPLGLAPTTSTTMMLALGDALAVTLLDRRGFGRDDFRTFHPGGSLGRGLLRVAALMHTENLPLTTGDTPVRTLAETVMSMPLGPTGRVAGCAGIVDSEGSLVGIITDGDMRRYVSSGQTDRTAAEIMHANPQTIAPDALVADALRLMTERSRPIVVLFVVEHGKPVGILHVHDLLQAGVM
jgi:arabinose-5-phosphate isomerase